MEIVYARDAAREMVQVREAATILSSIPLVAKLACPPLLMLFAEMLDRFFPRAQASREAYRLAMHTVEALQGGVDEGLVYLYFSFWILRLSGFFPFPFRCCRCGKRGDHLLEKTMELFCRDCAPSPVRRISGNTVGLVERFAGTPLDQLPAPERDHLRDLAALVTRVRRHALGGELNAYPFLAGCDKLIPHESPRSSLRSRDLLE